MVFVNYAKSQSYLSVHHIRKMAALEQKGKSERPDWMEKIAARRRKTLVVCFECHHKIQYGRYDRKSPSALRLLESDVIRKR